MNAVTKNQSDWERYAVVCARRLRWSQMTHLSQFWLVGAGLVILVTGLILRLLSGEWSWLHALTGLGAFMLICSLWIARTQNLKIPLSVVYARLDSVLGLNCRLSTAAAGKGAWPEFPQNLDDGLRLKWRRILPVCALSIALALLGALVPLPVSNVIGLRMSPPRSHAEIAAALSKLETADVLKPEELAKLKQELDSLEQPGPENWYSHSNLEAADTMQAGLENTARSLQKEMEKAASGLESLKSKEDGLNPEQRKGLADQFKSAVEALKSASPGINQNLMDALSKIAPSDLKSLSQKDASELVNQLKKASSACKDCAGTGNGTGQQGGADANQELEKLLGGGKSGRTGRDPGDSSDGPGDGGVARGPGVAALPLSSEVSDLGTNKPESLANPDLSRAQLGDNLGASDAKHQLDRTRTGPVSAGAAVAGQGGETVSPEALLPSETALLKSYFR